MRGMADKFASGQRSSEIIKSFAGRSLCEIQTDSVYKNALSDRILLKLDVVGVFSVFARMAKASMIQPVINGY